MEGIATQPLYLDVTMAPRRHLSHGLPAGRTAFAYLYDGRARFGPLEAGSTEIAAGQLAVLGDGEQLHVATEDAATRFCSWRLGRSASPSRATAPSS